MVFKKSLSIFIALLACLVFSTTTPKTAQAYYGLGGYGGLYGMGLYGGMMGRRPLWDGSLWRHDGRSCTVMGLYGGMMGWSLRRHVWDVRRHVWHVRRPLWRYDGPLRHGSLWWPYGWYDGSLWRPYGRHVWHGPLWWPYGRPVWRHGPLRRPYGRYVRLNGPWRPWQPW